MTKYTAIVCKDESENGEHCFVQETINYNVLLFKDERQAKDFLELNLRGVQYQLSEVDESINDEDED